MIPTIKLFRSDKPGKKYFIVYINPLSGRFKKTYFGSSGYLDYTIMPEDNRRKMLYLLRHSGMNEDYNNIYSPGALSKFLLWNKKTLDDSIEDTNRRFNVNIIKSF